MLRRVFCSLSCVVVVFAQTCLAAEPVVGIDPDRPVEILWPGGAPGALGDEPEDRPNLTIYRPRETPQKSAVIVCPGGGYGHLAVDHEGRQIGDWFNAQGITACVLRYRIAPKYHHPAPLTDAQRAVRYVRGHASEWGLDPQQIGMMGFSAGGHLTSSAGTHFDLGQADATDPIDRLSCRPDFLILAYPVISFTTEYAHAGSRKNLLGDNPPEELVRLFSNELQVTPQTPPTFLFHTSTDEPVPPENSVLFYTALRKAGVPAEMHIFEQGPHGVGLGQKQPELAVWPSLLANWLHKHGWLVRPQE